MTAVSSVGSLLAILEEGDQQLQRYALGKLDSYVHNFWFQISSSISVIEELYEVEEFQARQLAALLASKVFYYLNELGDAVEYALCAGDLFSVTEASDYVQTIVCRSLDKYVAQRTTKQEGIEIDPRLTSIVERMLQQCLADGKWEHALGLALESRRLDVIEQSILSASDKRKALQFAFDASIYIERSFKEQVLDLVIELYRSQFQEPDWIMVCQCLMYLDRPKDVAQILFDLVSVADKEKELLAYQIAFDLVNNDVHTFMAKLQKELKNLSGDTAIEATPQLEEAATDGMEVVDEKKEKVDKLNSVISGEKTIRLHLDFLYWTQKADPQILKNVKSSFDGRNSICHGATLFANAIMHVGTTVDSFLRENLEWVKRASNWAKFSAAAGLGVIHRGHLDNGKLVMYPYLPREDAPAGSSQYSEGGGLYALGLIYAYRGEMVSDFLLENIRRSMVRQSLSTIVQHGACLGLGLTCLGTQNEEVYGELKNVLYNDDAIAGEAAGLAMGLVDCGSSSEHIEEMLSYAHATNHEKIIRGLSIGLALTTFGREEASESLLEQMVGDADPIIRYGGMFALGLAYCGTSNNSAIQRLLHHAVSDVSDDVRRSAVMCLGFVLLNQPNRCPEIVRLLAASYNPHVRYGAAMAVGIACAGSGILEASDFLKPMMTDSVDFVRQGVFIASGLVSLQQPEVYLQSLRKTLETTVSNRHEEVMSKMGAIMATGIIDAGGRNVTVELRSDAGFNRRTAVVGLAVFLQYWYWHPLSYFLSLSFKSTALIALDSTLRTPALEVICSCKPSLFAYAKPISQQASADVSKIPFAILSTTAKKDRAKRKKMRDANEAQQTDVVMQDAGNGQDSGAPIAGSSNDNQQTLQNAIDHTIDPNNNGKDEQVTKNNKNTNGTKETQKNKEKEPDSYQLLNPARVVPRQVEYVEFMKGGRWQMVKGNDKPVGIVLCRDTTPNQMIEYVREQEQVGEQRNENGNGPAAEETGVNNEADVAAPEPFEYVPRDT